MLLIRQMFLSLGLHPLALNLREECITINRGMDARQIDPISQIDRLTVDIRTADDEDLVTCRFCDPDRIIQRMSKLTANGCNLQLT